MKKYPPLDEWQIPKFLCNARLWHIAIDKIPQARSWKDPSCLLTLEEAYQLLCKYDGDKPACLMLNLQLANIKVLDFDMDKLTGELRSYQLELVSHCETYTHVRKSSSGVGRHGYLNDYNNKLPKIAASAVNRGESPCEVKTDVIFVVPEVVANNVVAGPDKHTIDAVKTKRSIGDLPRPKPVHHAATVDELSNDVTFDERLANRHRARFRKIMKMVLDKNINILSDNASFSRLTIGLKSVGMSDDEIDDFCRQQDGYDHNVLRRIKSTKPRNNIVEQAAWVYSLFAKYDCQLEPTDSANEDLIFITPQGGDFIDYHTCVEAIGYKVRKDVHHGLQYSTQDGVWHDWTEDTYKEIYLLIQDKCRNLSNKSKPFNFSVETRTSAVDVLGAKNPHNGFLDYLNGLKESGKAVLCPEARNLFKKLFKLDPEGQMADAGFTDEEIDMFYELVASNIGMGLVRRTIDPGCIHDNFCVLLGANGTGKSLTLKHLLPPELRLFVESVDLTLESSERILACQQGVLVECSEMVGFTKKDIAAYKKMVSEGIPLARAKYGRKHLRTKLHHLMVATTNEEKFRPSDFTGDRRTIPVPLGRFPGWTKADVFHNVPIIVGEWRDRFFGDCLARVLAGQNGLVNEWPDRAQKIWALMLGETEHRNYLLESVLTPRALGLDETDRVSGIPFDTAADNYKVPSIMSRLTNNQMIREKLRFKTYPPAAIKAALKRMGYTFGHRRIIDGKKLRVCKPPDQPAPNSDIQVPEVEFLAKNDSKQTDKQTDKTTNKPTNKPIDKPADDNPEPLV